MKIKPEPGLSLVEVDEPQIVNSDDVKFRVAYCAICVTEMKVYDWNEWAASDPTLKLPAVLGHEVSGVVVEVGSNVKNIKVGDRITVDVMMHCGKCYQCRQGYTNLCIDREIYGKKRGAFAEYGVLPERVLCKLPEKLSIEEGTLMDNLGVAVHSVEDVNHEPGDVAVVIGSGPIGIMAAQTLAAYGVNVILTGRRKSRLEIARQLCKDAKVVDINEEDPIEIVKQETEGRGAYLVLEAAGTPIALTQAFDMVRDHGTIVAIGSFNEPVTFNPFFKLARREIKLVGTIGRTWKTWYRMVQLINSGKFNLKPLISHILPIEKYKEAFELAKSHDSMKVLLQP
jgi:2-desacetyl-2-hydroxyethyl bacteriochlorophyllide A dehydrogenase